MSTDLSCSALHKSIYFSISAAVHKSTYFSTSAAVKRSTYFSSSAALHMLKYFSTSAAVHKSIYFSASAELQGCFNRHLCVRNSSSQPNCHPLTLGLAASLFMRHVELLWALS